MTNDDRVKVLVETNGTDVSVQELEELDGRVALDGHGFFFHLGRVTPAETLVNGKTVTVWRWICDGYQGEQLTRKKAIAAMLADCGYEQTPLTATMPDLLEGL